MSMPAERVPAVEEVQGAIDAANGNEINEESNTDVGVDLWGDIAQEIDEETSDDLYPSGDSANESSLKEPVAPELEEETLSAASPAEEPNASAESERVIPVPPTEAKVETPQQLQPPVEVPQQQTPPAPRLTPEEQQAKAKEYRARVVADMAKEYVLSEEDATAFLTNPEEVVPKFRAELFLDVFDATMKSLYQTIPGVMKQVEQQTQARQGHEDAFYSANPLLDRTKHAATVNRFAQAYVTAVPGASTEQVIRDVGVQAMYALGINPAQVAAPSAPVVPAQQAYTPAGAGVRSGAMTKVDDGNIWGAIAEDLAEDD